MENIKNYINGGLIEPVSGEYIDNVNPSEGKVYSRIPDSDVEDIEMAVSAAENAFPEWSGLTTEKRASYLYRIADLIDRYHQDLAQAESADNGKPVKLARKIDIRRASSNFRFYASGIIHFASESHYTDGVEALNYTRRMPLGVVGCISPWNLPLYLFTWKIAPALAAGNTVVAKPSELTPMTAYKLADLCIKAELPGGVLNIVHGYGYKAGQAMVEHDKVKAISFTGGTETGKKIATLAAPKFKKLSLEMGGKNPNLIFDDCDIDRAVNESLKAAFSNQGEICLCGSRIFIQHSIYDHFKDEFLRKAKELKVGDPTEDDIQIGAIISEAHKEKILKYIDLAAEEGGQILCGGKEITVKGRCKGGYFIQPTVIEGLDYLCRTNQEEIFGPVVTLMPFNTEEEAIDYANSTPFGLSATIWTENLRRAHRVANAVNSGVIWVNCWLLRDLRTPFGGMKQSGVGREGGYEAFRFFTEAKNVCVKL